MQAYVCILHSNKLDSGSRNKFEWRKFRNQSALIVIILEAIVADRMSLVFSVKENLDGTDLKLIVHPKITVTKWLIYRVWNSNNGE